MQGDYGSWSNWSVCENNNKTCNGLGSMKRKRKCHNSSNQTLLGDKYCTGYNMMIDSCMPSIPYGMIFSHGMI